MVNQACQSDEGIQEAHQDMLAVIEALDIHRKLAEYDANHADQPMFQWARSYM